MKKNSLLLISIFIVTNVSAQSYKWSVYPTLGIDMGGAIPLPLSDIPKGAGGTPKLNPALGLGFEYRIKEKWLLGIEVNYHNLEFSAKADVRSQPFYFDNHATILYFSGKTQTAIELRFVEFPIIVSYRAGKNWSFLFGTYYSRILEGSFETEGKDGVISPDKLITDNAVLPGVAITSYNFNDRIDTYDLGLFLGYRYQVGPKLAFFGRFHWGFKSIFKKEFDNIEYEMYQLRLTAGISYSLFRSSPINQ